MSEAYRRNDILAVLGDNNKFWLCKLYQHVNDRTKGDTFRACWLETDDGTSYKVGEDLHMVPNQSILRRVRLLPLGAGSYKLVPKTKLDLEKALNFENEEHQDEDDSQSKPKTSSGKREATSTKKSEPKAKRSKKAPTTKKCEPKAKRPTPKVDKTNPNWKLKPRENIKVWNKDPLFESPVEVPFVSTSAHSHLVTRAVLLNDMALLKKCISDHKNVHSLTQRRSMALPLNAYHYALLKGNVQAAKIIRNEVSPPANKNPAKRAMKPRCSLKIVSTGVYNYRSLGIQNIRKLNMSRGGREGNNAFIKDMAARFNIMDSELTFGISHNVPFNVLKEVISMNGFSSQDILSALEKGHRVLASQMITHQMKALGSGCSFSKFHLESLTKTDKTAEWDPPIRETSVRKNGDFGVTPMHTACLNPSTKALNEIYSACPDLHLSDSQQRKPVHFAAVCETTAPLKFLVSKGAYLEDVNKEGVTPMTMACIAGRANNVKFLYDTLKEAAAQKGDVADAVLTKKFGVAGIDRPQRNTWCPLHHAVVEGHVEVADLLLRFGASIEKPVGTNFDRVTPLMLASARGDLDMVILLVKKYRAKIERPDKFKRTALTHAVMNGAANTASYLLNLGAEVNKPDTSGNTNFHYACAYGWYFCMKILADAGANLDAGNEWKLTPVAVAMLKGHLGIAKWLLEQPGVDINGRDDDDRSVLMTMIIEAMEDKNLNYGEEEEKCPLSKDLLEETTDMVERRKADPIIKDKFGRNLLHYLAGWTFASQSTHNINFGEDSVLAKNRSINKLRSAMQLKFLETFIDYGCDLFAVDEDGDLPVCKAFKMHQIRNYPVIEVLLKKMIAVVEDPKSTIESFKIVKNKGSVLHSFLHGISIAYIRREMAIFEDLVNVLKAMSKRGIIVDLACVVEAQVNNRSAFMQLCDTYATYPKINKNSEKHFKEFAFLETIMYNKKDDQMIGYDQLWPFALQLVERFQKEFNPKMTYLVKLNKDDKASKTFTMSAALAILGTEGSNEPCKVSPIRPGFKMLLNFCRVVDCLDQTGKSQLVKAVARGHVNQATNLLLSGADANLVYEENEEEFTLKSGKKVKAKPKLFPLVNAVNSGLHKLVKLLLSHDAELDPKKAHLSLPDDQVVSKQPVIIAIDLCTKNRSCRERLAILKELIVAGGDVNIRAQGPPDLKGMNGLHMAVFCSSGRADEALDLEILLIRNKCDVFAEFNGRYPLHETFRSSNTNPERKDPIEMCSMLVDAMDGRGIDKADEFGRTPLHYAAFCGATISCLLLLNKGN